ncbi:MAG: ribonuclease T2 [Okeania sp. SIO3I5]|uniref:ribonuclease T2 n=1 Tax=Okeania sp. SIO3I5 TaxID=2607805 RepID=UPI0013B71420|nr:ribonuclease T2 [Okeania sp. SIO3I5]NEQ39302.1 ribonuclease T2 [Okeania sp. SIO3I5]
MNKCEAYTSIKKKSEPVTLEPGKVYQAYGLNKESGDYISIKVGKQSKWINKNCGQLTPEGQGRDEIQSSYEDESSNESETTYVEITPIEEKKTATSCPPQGCAKEYVLAISWQPSFCQTKQYKPECISQTTDRYDATNFTLHGLWPDRIYYCGVSYEDQNDSKDRNWDDLPVLDLDEETTSELDIVMPGKQSYLHRHEWIKHGTCDGRNEDTYYDISVDLLNDVNTSEVQDLFEANIGKRITRSQIERAFDNSFGEGAGESVKIRCKSGLISELQIKMRRPLLGEKLADVLLPRSGSSCSSGIVDPVGF